VNKEQAAWSLLIAGLLLVCIYMVNSMSEQLDEQAPEGRVPTGQRIERDGITTPQYYVEGTSTPEPDEEWIERHLQARSAAEDAR